MANLTAEQRTTLAQHIRANTDPVIVTALAGRVDGVIADTYNQASTFIVWKTSVPPEVYRESVVWTEVDTLTVGKARIWEWLTGMMALPFNPSKSNVRTGIADCWAVGTTTRTQLLSVAKRAASTFEKVFATGTGTDATPGLLVVEGPVQSIEISVALNENP